LKPKQAQLKLKLPEFSITAKQMQKVALSEDLFQLPSILASQPSVVIRMEKGIQNKPLAESSVWMPGQAWHDRKS